MSWIKCQTSRTRGYSCLLKFKRYSKIGSHFWLQPSCLLFKVPSLSITSYLWDQYNQLLSSTRGFWGTYHYNQGVFPSILWYKKFSKSFQKVSKISWMYNRKTKRNSKTGFFVKKWQNLSKKKELIVPSVACAIEHIL